MFVASMTPSLPTGSRIAAYAFPWAGNRGNVSLIVVTKPDSNFQGRSSLLVPDAASSKSNAAELKQSGSNEVDEVEEVEVVELVLVVVVVEVVLVVEEDEVVELVEEVEVVVEVEVVLEDDVLVVVVELVVEDVEVVEVDVVYGRNAQS